MTSCFIPPATTCSDSNLISFIYLFFEEASRSCRLLQPDQWLQQEEEEEEEGEDVSLHRGKPQEKNFILQLKKQPPTQWDDEKNTDKKQWVKDARAPCFQLKSRVAV